MSRSKVISIAFVGIVAILVAASASMGMFRHHVTIPETRALLRERLPIGASTQRVVSLLDSLHVEHSGFVAEEGVIYAVWRRTSVSFFTETAIEARFYFNEGNRLSRYELKETVIGM